MMANDIEKIDELGRGRIVLLGLIALLMLGLAIMAGTMGPALDGPAFGIAVPIMFLAVVMLGALLVASGGALAAPGQLRALLNDEVTRDHRQRSLAAGFWAALIVAIGGYALSFPEIGALLGHLAAPELRRFALIAMLIAEAAALGRFAWLEAVAHGRG